MQNPRRTVLPESPAEFLILELFCEERLETLEVHGNAPNNQQLFGHALDAINSKFKERGFKPVFKNNEDWRGVDDYFQWLFRKYSIIRKGNTFSKDQEKKLQKARERIRRKWPEIPPLGEQPDRRQAIAEQLCGRKPASETPVSNGSSDLPGAPRPNSALQGGSTPSGCIGPPNAGSLMQLYEHSNTSSETSHHSVDNFLVPHAQDYPAPSELSLDPSAFSGPPVGQLSTEELSTTWQSRAYAASVMVQGTAQRVQPSMLTPMMPSGQHYSEQPPRSHRRPHQDSDLSCATPGSHSSWSSAPQSKRRKPDPGNVQSTQGGFVSNPGPVDYGHATNYASLAPSIHANASMQPHLPTSHVPVILPPVYQSSGSQSHRPIRSLPRRSRIPVTMNIGVNSPYYYGTPSIPMQSGGSAQRREGSTHGPYGLALPPSSSNPDRVGNTPQPGNIDVRETSIRLALQTVEHMLQFPWCISNPPWCTMVQIASSPDAWNAWVSGLGIPPLDQGHL